MIDVWCILVGFFFRNTVSRNLVSINGCRMKRKAAVMFDYQWLTLAILWGIFVGRAAFRNSQQIPWRSVFVCLPLGFCADDRGQAFLWVACWLLSSLSWHCITSFLQVCCLAFQHDFCKTSHQFFVWTAISSDSQTWEVPCSMCAKTCFLHHAKLMERRSGANCFCTSHQVLSSHTEALQPVVFPACRGFVVANGAGQASWEILTHLIFNRKTPRTKVSFTGTWPHFKEACRQHAFSLRAELQFQSTLLITQIWLARTTFDVDIRIYINI